MNSPTANDPYVTLIMPVRNEAAYLPMVLESLRRQSFAHDRLFLIAVDGDEEKATANRPMEALRSFARGWQVPISGAS
jgi:cellulose synthase/poly-beta-1,6-N-acetylglucosamine synthase-like glycosyltransferase